MSKHLSTDPINIKQAGMVSIIVTVILMFVISITVLGFAQVIRRSQREALDNQLSTQAFYAAESGINDARTILAANPGSSVTSCAKPSPPNPFSTLDYTVDAAHGVSYSCLLVEPSPSQLKYDLDPSAQSKIIPIDTHELSSYERSAKGIGGT
jgi:Tfp pilus assembly protein PilX